MRIAGSPGSSRGSCRIGTGSVGSVGSAGGRLRVGAGTGTSGTGGGPDGSGGVGRSSDGAAGGGVRGPEAFGFGGRGEAPGVGDVVVFAVVRWQVSAAGSRPMSSAVPVVIW